MNLGSAGVILILTLLGLFVVFLAVSVWALVIAARQSQWAWFAAIALGTLVMPIGPILGLVYLIVSRPERKAQKVVVPPAPGWYEDPEGRHESRFWNGAAWTAAVSDNGVPAEDPAS